MPKFSKVTSSEDRLLGKRHIDPDTGCWLWTGGGIAKGYGMLQIRYRHVLAHRLAWEVWRGPIPDGLCVLHHCDNPPCFNPDHLFLGTRADNNADKVRKGRSGFTTGPRPGRFPPGSAHPKAKLTDTDVLAILADPRPHRTVAVTFGVSVSTIYGIRRGFTWHHITQPQPTTP
jgi:hypothetical protein